MTLLAVQHPIFHDESANFVFVIFGLKSWISRPRVTHEGPIDDTMSPVMWHMYPRNDLGQSNNNHGWLSLQCTIPFAMMRVPIL